jgi:photosystem II stability/assembly factor-like uncharacterized protein
MGAFVLRKLASVCLAVLVAAAVPGCSGVQRAAQSSAAPSSAAEPVSSLPSSSEAVSSEPASSVPIGPRPGEAVSVSGENSDFQLHSLGFSGSGMGWVIEDRYNSGSDSYRSQLLTTPDGGGSWSETGTDGMWLDTACFADPTEGWAVSKEVDASVKVPAGSPKQVRYSILGTEDGGASWSVRWKSAAPSENTASQLRFLTAGTGFAMVGGKMLRTQDGGKSWTEVPSGLSEFVPKHFSFADAQNGWAVGSSGSRDRFSVLRTGDGGKSWSLQFQGKKQESGAAGVIDIDFISAREGWFLTSDMTTMNGTLYHTSDGGASWNSLGEQRICRPSADGLCFVDSQTGWIPLDHGAGPIDGGLSVTHDGGKTFRVLGETSAEGGGPRAITDAREILFRSKTEGWAVAMDSEHGDFLLHTSDGGATWEQMFPELRPTEDLSFPDEKNGFGLGALSDSAAVLKTEDGGDSWQTVTSLTGKYLAEKLSFVSPSEGWLAAMAVGGAAANGQVVLHTSDGGKSWAEVGRLPADGPEIGYLRFFDAENGILVESGKNEILSTSDGGETWRLMSEETGNASACQFYFLSSSNGWRVQNLGTGARVFLSWTTDGGVSWRNPPATIASAAGYESFAVCFASQTNGIILAGAQDGRLLLLTSSDSGLNWDPHSLSASASGSVDLTGSQLPVSLTPDGRGRILAPHGILVTADGGASWNWKK